MFDSFLRFWSVFISSCVFRYVLFYLGVAWKSPTRKLSNKLVCVDVFLFLYVAFYLIFYETCVICSISKFSSCVFCFRYGCLGPGMEPV